MLEPKDAEIYLQYECPQCQAIHIASPEETEYPGGALCFCGKKLAYKTITKVNIQFEYGESKTNNVSSNQEQLAAVAGLKKLGYSATQAKELVKGKNGNAQDIIQEILSDYSHD